MKYIWLVVFIILALALSGGLFLKPAFSQNSNIISDPPTPPPYTQWAWNDVIGWINFYPGSCPGTNVSCPNVNVFNTNLDGYASSQVGYIALNCNATNPSGANICSSSNFFVSNDNSGNLAGWAWNDQIGWISFCGNDDDGSKFVGSTWVCPGQPGHTNPNPPTYQVKISTSGLTQGEFSGWAWNDVIGWISFNCSNTSTCGTADYKVKTSWSGSGGQSGSGDLTSSVFDTCPQGVNCGAGINSIMWQGPAGGLVGFQIASSDNINGPWTFYGPNSNSSDCYTNFSNCYSHPLGPNNPIKITSEHQNKRYFRYKVYLGLDSNNASPQVDDIIISWNP